MVRKPETNEGNSLIESNRQRATAVAEHFAAHPFAQTRLTLDQRLAMVLLEIRPEGKMPLSQRFPIKSRRSNNDSMKSFIFKSR